MINSQDCGLPNETFCGGTPDDDMPDDICCPRCKKTNYTISVEWFAHSLDTCDLHNTAILTEYQCKCGKIFWLE